MTEEDEGSSSKAIVVRSDVIKHKHGDVELDKEISDIVQGIIQSDIRIADTSENREALRDYVRMEIILALKFKEAVNKPELLTAADERMIRSAVKMKMDLRDEVYDDVKGDPSKEKFIGDVREQVKKKIIKAQTKVDILDKP